MPLRWASGVVEKHASASPDQRRQGQQYTAEGNVRTIQKSQPTPVECVCYLCNADSLPNCDAKSFPPLLTHQIQISFDTYDGGITTPKEG